MAEHKTWKKTKHANNFEVLQGAEREEPQCVKCHVTGFGKPGGFVSEQETPGLKNVGCEACHGPGSEHIEAAKKAGSAKGWDTKIDKVPQNTCVECHNPHVKRNVSKSCGKHVEGCVCGRVENAQLAGARRRECCVGCSLTALT